MQSGSNDRTLSLAKAKLQAGELGEAEAIYRSVIDKEPDCAEALHFLGMTLLQEGRLNEALDAVQRSVQIEDNSGTYQSNLSMVLGLLKRFPDALAAAERAIELQPDSPEAWSSKGIALDKLRQRSEAIEAFREAVRLRPDYVEATGNFGDLLSRSGVHDEAIELLRKASALRPREALRRKALGNALRRAGRSDDAVAEYRAAAELNPKDADIHNNLGAALSEIGQVVEAEQALRRCLSLNPNHTDAHLNLSLALLSLGRWTEGWVQYEWRRHLKSDIHHNRRFVQPEWNGAKLEGSTILVCCEQGLGDAIQFIRYVPRLAEQGAKVLVECQPKLMGLIEGVPGVAKVIAYGEPFPPFDVHVRLMSLPGIFGTTPRNVPAGVPYLTVAPERVERMEAKLGPHDGLRVGLVWQGCAEHRRDRFRSISLEKLAPLAQVPGVQWVSLQKGAGSEQVDQSQALKQLQWSDPSDTTGEALLDTAAVIKCLNLVIAVDTGTAHLAGALGVAVWVALPYSSDWRWLQDREDTPWYPTMRLFRQTQFNRWDDVIGRLVAALRQRVSDGPDLSEHSINTSAIHLPAPGSMQQNGCEFAPSMSREILRIEKDLARLRQRLEAVPVEFAHVVRIRTSDLKSGVNHGK